MLAITIATVLTGCQADEITPARAVELLREAHRAMESAERLLDDKNVPEAENRERDAVDRLSQVLKSAKASRDAASARKDDRKNAAEPAGSRGRRPEERGSKFGAPASTSAAWGRLPPEIRRAMLAAAAEDVPPQYREYWKRYFESLENATK